MAFASQELPLFVVDAFASSVFHGNPAAVVPIGAAPFPPDDVLQAVAKENNLAETAFFRADAAAAPGRFHLRWFTPEHEIDLCGHATLAAAFVAFRLGGAAAPATLTFDSRTGPLTVTRLDSGLLELDFPSRPPVEVARADWPAALSAALGGATPLWVGKSRDYVVLLESPAAVKAIKPNFRALDEILDAVVVIATAAGDSGTFPGTADFVSRAFCPNCSVPEDPVCGSAHCSLIPFFAERLLKTDMLAHQVSARGGVLHSRLVGDRVKIAGSAVLYSHGTINVPLRLLSDS